MEREAPGTLPLLQIGCRHHKLERDFDSAWKAAFPEPTKAPADRLCEKLYAAWEKKTLPTTLDQTCRYIFRSKGPFYQNQRKRLNELAEKMARTAEKNGALPRDDYRVLLNLVQVSTNPGGL